MIFEGFCKTTPLLESLETGLEPFRFVIPIGRWDEQEETKRKDHMGPFGLGRVSIVSAGLQSFGIVLCDCAEQCTYLTGPLVNNGPQTVLIISERAFELPGTRAGVLLYKI